MGIGSDILYRLKEGNSSLFNINSNGTISCKPLWINDRNNGTYKFTVEAYNLEKYERCQPSPCVNGTQTVTIYLQVSGCIEYTKTNKCDKFFFRKTRQCYSF